MLALPVLSSRPMRDIRDVLDPQRHAAPCRDDDLADFVDIFDPPARPHDDALAIALDIIGAAAHIIGLDRGDDILEGKAIADQLGRIRLHLVLLHISADRVGASQALHALHLRTNDPILNGAEVDDALELIAETLALGRQIGAIALPPGLSVVHGNVDTRRNIFDSPPIYFAKARRDRAELHLHAGRQRLLDFAQTLIDLLAGEINIGLVAEDGRDLRKPISRKRARIFKTRSSRERRFDRESHLLFDFNRRQRRSDAIDLNLIVGDIGDRIDRQIG